MLIPYIYYIIGGGALLVVLLIAALVWWYFCNRKKKRAFEELMEYQCGPVEEQDWPRLTLLVICHEIPAALKRSLPSLLSQDYPNYEVVVVNVTSSEAVNNVVEEQVKQYDNIRSTFISSGNQIDDIQRFSLMLGLRAARTEWIVVTMPGAVPASEEWLKRMVRHASDNADLVIGTGEGINVQNYCVRKSALEACGYSLEKLEKSCKIVYEWSPQACIYQHG